MLEQFDIRFLREREDHAATQGFAGGLALGIILGIVLTLVFAPRRGDETRAAVASLAHEAKERTVSLVGRQDADQAAAIEREIGGAADEPASAS